MRPQRKANHKKRNYIIPFVCDCKKPDFGPYNILSIEENGNEKFEARMALESEAIRYAKWIEETYNTKTRIEKVIESDL